MFISYQNHFRRKLKQDGFSLLEVLMTIVVLSFGLLGMAALITTGMRSNNVAHYRSIATQQAQDIADRMRANLVGVRAGAYDALTVATPTSEDCVVDNCSAVEMAVYDHSQWNAANATLLPGGSGTVGGSLAGGFQITMMWTEKEMGGDADPNPNPNCPGTANTRCFVTTLTP